MRHTRLAAFLGVLLALPLSGIAFSRSSADLHGERTPVVQTGKTHDRRHEVTSNGVTKVQLQHLYKEDWLVTDVTGSGVWPSNAYTKAEIDEMTNAVFVYGLELSGRVMSNWTDIVLLKLADLHLALSNNTALARIENLYTNLDLTAASISNLANRVPFRAPSSAYAAFASGYPTVRVTTGNGIGFYVLGTDGLYYDSRELSRRGVTPAFDVRTLYGRTFTPEYLSSNISAAVWESGFTLSASNIGSRLIDVCTVTGYPYVYGEVATVRDLIYDLLAIDRSLWSDETGFRGHERDFMDLSGLRTLALRGTVYTMRAHEEIAQLRYDTRFTDDNAAFRLGVLSVVPESDFTPSNRTLVSTVDSRLSPSNSAFVSAVSAVLPPVPTKVSDLTNDAEYVTADVTNGIPESIAAATNGLPELIAGSTNGLVSASNPVFADAVLAVGLNVSTNDVEAIHRILDEGGDIDWSEYGTVGGALAALIAGFAWLRRKAYASVTAAEVADGVWSLSDGPVTDGNKTSY